MVEPIFGRAQQYLSQRKGLLDSVANYQFTPANAEFRKNDNLSTLRQGKAT